MGGKVKGRFCCFIMGILYMLYANENYPIDREYLMMLREEIILGATSLGWREEIGSNAQFRRWP